MKGFIIKTLSLSLGLIIVKYISLRYLFPNAQIPLFILIVIFFFAVTNFVHYHLLRITEKNVRKFNTHFLGMNMIKMFVYFLVALIYLWFYREFAKEFLISLFIIYAGYSAIEVIELTRIVKQKN